MSSWVVVVPVWGPRYVSVFLKATLPALRYAIHKLGGQRSVKVVLYNDDARLDLAAAFGPGPIHMEIRPLPDDPGNPLLRAAQCHRDAISRATHSQRLLLLTADMVISGSTLASCEERFTAHSKRLIVCAGMRVNDDKLPGVAEYYNGRALLDWGWTHRHAMTRESTWPDGHSYDIWRMYFQRGGSVVCRLALPHPIALMKDNRRIKFAPTIDVNLVANYKPSEIHLVTSPDELAVVELSPPDKEFLLTESMKDRHAKRLPSMPSFTKVTHPRHIRFLEQRIIIKGQGEDCGEREAMSRFLEGV